MAEPLRRDEFESAHIESTDRPVIVQHPSPGGVSASEPERQAYIALRIGFIAAPILAGLDKFFHVLTNWDKYLAPFFPGLLGIDGHNFMLGVGILEMIAGIGVALKPKLFGYIVSAWLLCIVANLLVLGDFYDIALRDFGLSLGAFALARLASRFVEKPYRQT